MSSLKKVSQLKERLESMRAEVERAKGSLDSTLRRLSEKFGCSSLGEGEKVLADLKVKRDRLAKKLKRSTEKFERKWGDVLK